MALFNTRTEQFVNAPVSKAAQELPPGMVMQVGTAGGALRANMKRDTDRQAIRVER